MALGVGAGEPVLMNAFTLAPVPGAIVHARGDPVFVGITPDYEIDLDDLRAAAERSGSRLLMLSHMRGHITDMDRLMEVAAELDLTVIEDCAHTMGAGWDGRPSGTFGAVGCFSTQTSKHVNSGEGGLLVTDDDDVAARAILPRSMSRSSGPTPWDVCLTRWTGTPSRRSATTGQPTAQIHPTSSRSRRNNGLLVG